MGALSSPPHKHYFVKEKTMKAMGLNREDMKVTNDLNPIDRSGRWGWL
jgi:hypothetical protein